MKLAKKILELLIFFFLGVLIRLAFSMQLNWVYNIVILFGVIAIIAYISITQILDAKNNRIIETLKEIFRQNNIEE